MDNSTRLDGTKPSDIPPDGFYQKFKIPMFILFSTIAIAILGSTIWQWCFRKKSQNNDLEELTESQLHHHHHLPPFIGHVHGHLHGGSSARGREDDIMHLPYSYPYSLPFPFQQQDGSACTSTRDRDRHGNRGRQGGNRTSSGWWRHSHDHAGPDNRLPLYQRRQTRLNRISVPPTTGTPLDRAYSMAYMQEETQTQTRQEQSYGQQHGQEEYEMMGEEAMHKGQQARREATPPPPYKARRSTDDACIVYRPPGCLCGHV